MIQMVSKPVIRNAARVDLTGRTLQMFELYDC